MILAAHQPAYLPWLGYLDKIARADIFVYLDMVQYEKNSFINRNKIKTAQGAQWLTIPVFTSGYLNSNLLDLRIDNSRSWQIKHLKSIEMNYKKSQFFAEKFPMIQNLMTNPEHLLVELCWRQLQFWLSEFSIKTEIIRLSELEVTSSKSDLILHICEALGANHYLSGPFGKAYLNLPDFSAAGINVSYQNFIYPIYPQLYGDFESHLSAIDALFNCGSGVEYLISNKNFQEKD